MWTTKRPARAAMPSGLKDDHFIRIQRPISEHFHASILDILDHMLLPETSGFSATPSGCYFAAAQYGGKHSLNIVVTLWSFLSFHRALYPIAH